MLNETTYTNLDEDCLSANLVDHQKDHMTNLDSHPSASLSSSIFHNIHPKTSESKALSSLQTQEFTADSLKSFIRKIWVLKNERKLPDDTAVCALPLLLPDVAYQWWEDTRPFVKTWNLAIALMLKVLNDKRTLKHAWEEFETTYHQYDKHLLTFLNGQRILLAEIRQFKLELTEQMEMDLIFHKLNSTIKKKFDRRKLTSFEELIRLARLHGLMACDPNLNDSTERCDKCYATDHTETQCTDLKYVADRDVEMKRYRSSVVPSVPIKLNGIPAYVHLASDSQLNIITDSLYLKLLQRGCLFESTRQVVATINSHRTIVLHMATVLVECNHHLIATPVIKLQNTRGIKNCFGIGFIESCDLLSKLGCE